MAFTDLDTVKGVVGIPAASTRFDAALQAALDAAESEWLEALSLDATAATTYELTADAMGLTVLRSFRLEPVPVISVDELVILGSTVAATRWTLRDNQVRLKDPIRLAGQDVRIIEATVTAGFAAVPDWLARAVAVLAAARHKSEPAPGVVSERFGRYAITRTKPGEAGNPLGWPAESYAAYARLVGNVGASMITARRE